MISEKKKIAVHINNKKSRLSFVFIVFLSIELYTLLVVMMTHVQIKVIFFLHAACMQRNIFFFKKPQGKGLTLLTPSLVFKHKKETEIHPAHQIFL